MDIHVVSAAKTVREAFAGLDRGRTVAVHWHTSEQGVLSEIEGTEAFLYLDVSGMNVTTVRRKLSLLEKTLPFRYGLIDPKGVVDDPAEAFHRSASDFLGRAALKGGVTSARMRRVLEYRPHAAAEPVAGDYAEAPELPAPPSGQQWEQIVRGQEYTFLMLYVGIDRVGDLRRKLSEGFLAGVRKSLLSIVQEYLAPHGVRLWMWKEDDGLLLLPFDGESVDALPSALLMRLNWPVHQTENPRDFGEVSWRLGFHLGATTYETGRETGEIVSEDVNFVFHFGGRSVEHGSIACTEPVFRMLSPRLRELFTREEPFEGQSVFRMKSLL